MAGLPTSTKYHRQISWDGCHCHGSVPGVSYNMNYADEIKNTLSAIQVAEFYGLTPNRAGYICCLWHNEKTGSLKLYEGNRGFYCFGCGKNGSCIDIVMQLFGLNFLDACKKINEDFRLGLPIGQKLDRRKRLAMAEADFRRKTERKLYEAGLAELDREYDKAFRIWQIYDTWAREFKPTSNRIYPLYVEAVKNIDKAAYEVDQAEEAREEYVRQHNSAGTKLHGG